MDRRKTHADRRVVRRGGRRQPDYSGRPVVLIVDDHVDSRELLATVLQDIGVIIAEAGTGEDALARAATQPLPALILVDLALPDCHGTDVVRAIKRMSGLRHIPIVALSASVMASDKAAAAEAGCIGFIEKPLMPDDVIDRVRRFLSGTRV